MDSRAKDRNVVKSRRDRGLPVAPLMSPLSYFLQTGSATPSAEIATHSGHPVSILTSPAKCRFVPEMELELASILAW